MRKQRTFLHQCLRDASDAVRSGRGRNVIPPPERPSMWRAYIDKFRDPLIVVLLVVFVFSVGVSLYEVCVLGRGAELLLEPLGVLAALLLATGVGFVFEVKAEREFEVLNRVKDKRPVKVYRRFDTAAGEVVRIREVRKHDVCVGDYVFLENGDEVPADGTLDESNDFMVDESDFTGEPYARKSALPAEADPEATFPTAMLLRGSTVIGGNAIYHVESVGMDTMEGRGVAKVREGSEVQTPLNRQLDRLGRILSRLAFLVAALIVAGRMVYYFVVGDGAAAVAGHHWVDVAEFVLASVMLAVTLVVVAVPEGLPMSVTVSLALSMRKMLRENNLVRKLHACETMGATTVICTDKTGTLTQNKMSVVETDFYGSGAEGRVRLNMALNSTAELSLDDEGREKPLGNPTEGALLFYLKSQGADYEALRHACEQTDVVPFSTERKYMQTTCLVRKADGAEPEHIRLVKGAPEIVLAMCGAVAGGQTREHVERTLRRLQSHAMRTLAFASQTLKDGAWSPLTFDGLVGIADPVRPDVREAIDACTRRAGVRVVIVTGDTPGTANEIGRQVGLLADGEEPQTVTGEAFGRLSDDEALRLVARPDFKIVSRARPDDKARLVTLLQRLGEVVAVTGDGTNDAPALSKAQVGLSMGDGTARAKEASDITIIDNSFASIVKAIVWGRSLYRNIQRFILFQTTINVSACLIVLLGAFTGQDSPLGVTQMLWVNLIMDTFAAMALSSLPADRRVLDEAPRNPASHIIPRRMAVQIFVVGTLFFLVLAGLWQLLWHVDLRSAGALVEPANLQRFVTGFFDLTKQKPHLTPYELGLFFTFFVMMQFWNLFNARYFRTGRSLTGDVWNKLRGRGEPDGILGRGFMGILAAILAGQVLIVTFAGSMFGVAPLTLSDWLLLALLSFPVLALGELWRIFGNFRAPGNRVSSAGK